MSRWLRELSWTGRALMARCRAEWDLARMPVYRAARRRGLGMCEPGAAHRTLKPARAKRAVRLALRATRRVFRGTSARDTCLVQALVLGELLADQEPALMIGVAHGLKGEFFAHAWIDIDGEPIELLPRPASIELVPLSESSRRAGFEGEVESLV